MAFFTLSWGIFIKESFSLNEDPPPNTSPRHTSTQALDPYLHSTLIIGKARAGTRHYRQSTDPQLPNTAPNMNAFAQELAAARFRVGTADDRVEHLIHRQDALYPVLQEARQRYHTLSDLYAGGCGGFGLELEYHRHRNIYYSIREDYLELCDRLDEAEEVLDEMIAGERVARARFELLRRRAEMEREDEYLRSRQERRYVRPDYARANYARPEEERERRYQNGYDYRSQSPRYEERRPRTPREQPTRDSSRSYTSEERRPRSRQEPWGQDSFRGRFNGEHEPGFRQHHRSRNSPGNDHRQREQPRQGRPPRSAPTPADQTEGQHLPRPSDGVVNGWWKVVNDSFKDYSKMDRFPNPPVCTFCDEGHCDSSIKALLRRIPNLNAKKERLRWHPDRFSACKEDKREEFKKRAGNVFMALDEMSKE